MLWTYERPSTCLGQLDLSLFLWSTARCEPWGTCQHQSSPFGEARPGPRGSAKAHLDRDVRSRAEEHVATLELSSQRGRARCHGTRGNAGAHLGRETRFGAEVRVAVPELNSARRRGPGPRGTWQHRSSPQQGGEVRGRGTRGGSGAHLCKEVWSETTAYVAALRCMSCSLS
jgi:hypothetical protein